MHLLLIHQAFAALNQPGGTRHHELARHLAGRGHRVTIIASPVSYLTGAAEAAAMGDEVGITILRARAYRAHHKSFVHRVLAFLSFMVSSFLIGLRVRDVDIVWGTSPPIFQGLTAWLLARLKGARFLFEVRDLWPAFAVAVGVLRNPLLIRASEGLERFLYRRADRLMVNSPGFVAHVAARAGREPALIPNGADVSMFDPAADGADFRKAHGLEGRFVALYAGAHGLSNDLGVALEAARRLADAPQVVIVLLGDGKEKPALMAQAEGMALTNVRFLPPVAKEGMAEALAAADCGIAILKPLEMYKTTYPNKVFDYLAAGRPVALAIDGVIRDVVEQAGAGLFAQPGDPAALAAAIRQLAADPAAARRMGLSGRAYLEEHFDRGALAEQFEALLRELVGDGYTSTIS
ncbi:MAG: glycosyltransferase family 4 protein [Chloroflexi bacterium]|nr:glycosyltransferase family 4 protein [Chloroflexota bacterium]